MRAPRLALSALVPLTVVAAGGVAHAQEGPPGLCDCAVAAPAPAPAAPQGWDGRRWSVGLHVGGLTVHPESDPEATTSFGGGGLHVRYRINRRWGVELRTDSLREQLEDGSPGEQQLGAVTIGAAFHLTPDRRWDWYLVGGVGGAADARPEATDAEIEASQQALGYLGVGVERRFGRIGLSAELRAIGLEPAERAGDEAPAMTDARGAVMPGIEDDAAEATAGGMFTVGVAYHF